MRKVVIQGTPPAEWVAKAKVLEKKLTDAATPDERSTLIEKHQAHWRDDRIRNWLLKQFNDKCWYSEARDTAAPIHVDHFRPKGRVTEKDEPTATAIGGWLLNGPITEFAAIS